MIKNIKYHGIETIKFLVENHNDCNLYLINCQQYQAFPDKALLTLNEYFERTRPELTRLVSKACKVKLVVNFVFRSIKNFNDKRNIHIKIKNTTNIGEIFNQLIKKHENLYKSLKEIGLVSESIESITYNFTEIIKNT